VDLWGKYRQLAKNLVYNNVGVVNLKVTTLLPMRGESCQGRQKLAFIEDP